MTDHFPLIRPVDNESVITQPLKTNDEKKQKTIQLTLKAKLIHECKGSA